MRIDEGTLREILARTDIGGFIGSYVALRKRGNDLVGLCPFHAEKTPSFHVHPDRGFFKCFGCGKGGDVIRFVQYLENATFPDAARMLARRAGVALEEEDPAAARARTEKEHIYAANEAAAAFFAATLRLAPEGAAGRAYAEQRGFDAATIEAFKLGYAPPAPPWNRLARELQQSGIDLAVAEKAGLVRRGESGYYDVYRGRLIVPTHATTGEIVAFGGRALDDAQPKYLNTATTPVYTKGRGLFALNVARRAAASRHALLVVEGYLDCIALHQAGFTHAVASLGTAFTPEQAAELRKYAERIYLCFDADAAGLAATQKSIDVLDAAGCTAFVVTLPEGQDPDTFVRSAGAAAFSQRLDAAVSGVQFKLDREIADIVASGLPRAKAARSAESLVRALPREEWDRWRVYVAQALELSVDDVRNSRFASNPANFAPRPDAASRMVRYVAPTAEPPSVERDILAAFVDEPALVAEYAVEIGPEVFKDPRYGAIYAAMRQRAEALVTPADVYAALGDDREAVALLAALQKPDRSPAVRFQDSEARRAHLNRIVDSLRESRLERRYRELDRKIDEAFVTGATISADERDEHRRLGEDLQARKKRRLGAR